MELELESVRRWFSRLRSMQSCASNISNDTPTDLTDFYKKKHAEVLTEQAQKDNFAFCMFRNTSISISNHDFEATSTFAELLNESHRQLRTAVRGLFRAIAISLGTVPSSEDPASFETRLTTAVFGTEAQLDELCKQLASVMPIFPQSPAGQSPFRTLLKKPATTVKAAIDKTIEA